MLWLYFAICLSLFTRPTVKELTILVIQIAGYAPLVLMKTASQAYARNRYGEAGTALRRSRIIFGKILDEQVKHIAKTQAQVPKEEIKKNFESVKQKVLPQMMEQKQFKAFGVPQPTAVMARSRVQGLHELKSALARMFRDEMRGEIG